MSEHYDRLQYASLFTGIGGFDLPAKELGFKIVFQCEIDQLCNNTLNFYHPDATKHNDITTTDFTIYRNRIDVLSSGFPCQDISKAGTQNGLKGERSGLFFENIRATNEIRPKVAIWENVSEVRKYLPEIIGSYSSIGYCLAWHTVRASWFGFPHQRERMFGIAYNTDCIRWEEIQNTSKLIEKTIWESSKRKSSGTISREIQLENITKLCLLDDGIPPKLHGEIIKAFGNAVIPEIAFIFLNSIYQSLFINN